MIYLKNHIPSNFSKDEEFVNKLIHEFSSLSSESEFEVKGTSCKKCPMDRRLSGKTFAEKSVVSNINGTKSKEKRKNVFHPFL